MQTASPLACRSCSTVNGKKKRSRARLFFTRKSEFLYLSISLECVCSSRQRRQSGAVCSLQFSLPQKPPRAKRYQFISIHATDASKCSFSIDFFYLAKKSRPFFLTCATTDDRRKKSKEGRENRNFLFLCPNRLKKRTTTTTTTTQFFRLFFLFFFAFSKAEGKKASKKKAKKGDALHCRYTRAFK